MIKALSTFFNQSQSPSLFTTLTEIPRAVAESACLGVTAPFLMNLPSGDGHPVLIIPGFSVTDNETYILRQFLKSKGYRVHAMNMGRNVGPMAGLEKRLSQRVKDISQTYGQKVSVIGWSLGGLFARYIGHEVSDHVRIVISLGSPLGINHDYDGLAPFITKFALKTLSADFLSLVDDDELARWNNTPPVPTCAIYSYTDGVVHWTIATDPLDHRLAENVHVPGSHSGLTHNTFVFAVLADRLAMPEGQWSRFEYQGVAKELYRLFDPFKKLFKSSGY